VFTNLLHNAFKFTPERGHVTVNTTRENEGITVSIIDTGCGIAPEELPLLFQRYRRTVATRHREGTGLGLFIVKMLIEAHGGRVEADSIPNKGSCFTVWLSTSVTQHPEVEMRLL